jgi:hypothetical protein
MLALMRAAWPIAVGAELARRTEVAALDGRLLRIRVPDATWQRALLRMRREILARLRDVAGASAPYKLGFVEGAIVVAPAARQAPRTLPAPPPADLAAAAQSIRDPEIRERFLASVAAYLARFGPAAARDD